MRREHQAIERMKNRMQDAKYKDGNLDGPQSHHGSVVPSETPPLQNMALKSLKVLDSTENPDEIITSPKRLYMVGKFKDYRKLVGLDQIKSHLGDPDLNMSQKRRRTLNMQIPVPTQELSLAKTNRRGALINDAIQEIIFNLEKYDKK